jgi:hypothetical protein
MARGMHTCNTTPGITATDRARARAAHTIWRATVESARDGRRAGILHGRTAGGITVARLAVMAGCSPASEVGAMPLRGAAVVGQLDQPVNSVPPSGQRLIQQRLIRWLAIRESVIRLISQSSIPDCLPSICPRLQPAALPNNASRSYALHRME